MVDQLDLFKVDHSIDTSKGSKVCQKCNKEMPVTSFEISGYRRDGTPAYKNFCNPCKNPHKRFIEGKRKTMPVPEGHVCPICSSTLEQLVGKLNPLATVLQTFVLDHNHDTMTVRDYLCHNCNNGLGKFNDDVNLLRNAVSYLEKHEKKC